jgi:hypothetical protein
LWERGRRDGESKKALCDFTPRSFRSREFSCVRLTIRRLRPGDLATDFPLQLASLASEY